MTGFSVVQSKLVWDPNTSFDKIIQSQSKRNEYSKVSWQSCDSMTIFMLATDSSAGAMG